MAKRNGKKVCLDANDAHWMLQATETARTSFQTKSIVGETE